MTRRRLIDTIVRPLEIPGGGERRLESLMECEWLVTNGLGGYASSSVACINTRRYHGLLVAALPNPFGRMVMLGQLSERIAAPAGEAVDLSERETGAAAVAAFRLEAGLPVWELSLAGSRIEKRVLMPHEQNTVIVSYRLLEGTSVSMELRPRLHFRGYEEAVNTGRVDGYHCETEGDSELVANGTDLPPLRMRVEGAASFVHDTHLQSEIEYPVEASRGYAHLGTTWSPGYYRVELQAGSPIVFIASTEDPAVMNAMTIDDARWCEFERRRRLVRSASEQMQDPIGIELVLAADQFIITPAGRVVDATRARAMGGEVRTVIAGYHWFTDWGRDTMISLEGLTLVTGREREAAFILRTFAHYVRDGLIPNMFPDGSNEGLYHTADATLWFFHALERYRLATGDDDMIVELLPVMHAIVEAHERGTRFGIHMDPADSLLSQGAEGYQLTWMDAKVDGWVVTPRRGKAVEINALWHNALCNVARWTSLVRGEQAAVRYAERAAQVRESFNKRFWNPARGFLFDVVDGEGGRDSDLCRPNQVFAISLEHPVLDRERWPAVMQTVEERLLTPVGLRSLAPGEPDYKSRYFGDLRARDAAYHQGTVWGWLIGPFVEAWLKLHPDEHHRARKFLDGLVTHLDDFGIGSVAEIFDATEPYTARGCIAQAWSVAELARCWAMTSPGFRPTSP